MNIEASWFVSCDTRLRTLSGGTPVAIVLSLYGYENCHLQIFVQKI